MPNRLSLSDFRAVLFDVDGTLVNSVEVIVCGLDETIVHFGGPKPRRETILAKIGSPLRVQLHEYEVPEVTEDKLEKMFHFAIERFDAYAELEVPFQAAVNTLHLCKERGMKTALVTSKSRSELVSFFRRFPATEVVDVAVTSSDVAHPKPHPESAELACQWLGVTPQEAVLVGDSVFDVCCARSAGLSTVAVSYGAANRSMLEAERPDLLLHTPEELFDWAETAFLQSPCHERS